MYRVASLFCGCGGADVGLLGDFVFNGKEYEKLPFELVYATDINQKAVDTHNANFSCKNVVCGDISTIEAASVPDHDVLIGGFPCQSFSTVNPTKNPFDDRANLYRHMVRIAKEKEPDIIIMENVKGFKTLHGGAIFAKVIAAFERIGYLLYPALLNAADFGVPQKRERVIIVGVKNTVQSEFVFPDGPTVNKWVPLSVAVPRLCIDDAKYYFSKRAVEGMKKAKNNMKRGLAQNLSEPCLTVTSHLAKVSLNSRDPVLLVDPEKELYRRFTPREAARIQSFPEEFMFKGSEGDAYRQIGNAVPPVLFWYIAQSVAEYLETAVDCTKARTISA